MKLLCAFMVVMIHCQFLITGKLSAWIKYGLNYGFCRIAVPFFFVISGYFLAKHMNELNWWRKGVQKRFRGLVLPYLISVLSFMLLSYAANFMMANAVADAPTLRLSLKTILIDMGVHPGTPPLLVAMWYVRALCVIILLSPLLCRIIFKTRRIIALAVLVVMAVVCFCLRPYSDCGNSLLYYVLNYGLSLEGLLYFSIGIFLFAHPVALPSRKVGLLCLVLGVGCFVWRGVLLINMGMGWRSCQVGFFAIPLTILGLYCVLPKLSLPSALKTASFPVYVFHLFFLSAIGGRISRGGGGWFEPDPSLAHWLLRVVVAFVLSITLTWIGRKMFPRAMGVLLGGR